MSTCDIPMHQMCMRTKACLRNALYVPLPRCAGTHCRISKFAGKASGVQTRAPTHKQSCSNPYEQEQARLSSSLCLICEKLAGFMYPRSRMQWSSCARQDLRLKCRTALQIW